ncbi:hypothetical protein PHAVU_006G222201 [Phaseolus vulgaris]
MHIEVAENSFRIHWRVKPHRQRHLAPSTICMELLDEKTDVFAFDMFLLEILSGGCGECAHCKSEESNMCELLRMNTDRGVMINDGQPRFSKNGKPIYHFLGTSTFFCCKDQPRCST